jgi:hypothetical protein
MELKRHPTAHSLAWISSASSVLLAAVAFLFVLTAPARAEEHNFCWGKSLPLLGEGWCQDSTPRWITAVYGSGSKPTCAGATEGAFLCTHGANEGVYVGSPYFNGSANLKATLYNNSSSKGDVVYGVVWSNPEGPSPPPPPPPAATWHFDDLGGNISGDPDISSWGANRLDVFGRAADGSYAHTGWTGSSWTPWENLGGAGAIVSGVGSVGKDGNRIDAVGRTSNGSVLDLYFYGSWHTENMGGNIVGDPDISSWGGSDLDLWGRGTDNTLMHKWWTGTKWSAWESLGSKLVTLAGSPAAVSWGPGRVDVASRASDGSVQDTWWNGSTWQTSNLGGVIIGDPELSTSGEGILNVFARGLDDTLQHKWYQNGSWSNWESLGGSLASSPGAVSWDSNRIDVVARGADGSILHWWWG